MSVSMALVVAARVVRLSDNPGDNDLPWISMKLDTMSFLSCLD